MVRKVIGVFCPITLVLSTLQVDETLMWTQVNTSNKVGMKLIFENKVFFLVLSLTEHRHVAPQI